MKIGILTFHQADNYGAVLQALGLQEFLKKNFTTDVDIIDYENKNIIEQSKLISANRGLKITIVNILFFIPNLIRKIKFKIFRKNHLCKSEKYDQNNISESNTDYDIFITGSDQVWNRTCTGEDYNYFLKFVDDCKKKIAYAASFGFESEVDKFDEIEEFLKRFSAIGLRENFNNLLLKEYKIMPDPVFLLCANEWKDMLKLETIKKSEYIFVYTVMVPVKLMDVVKKYSEKYNLPVIYVNDWIRFNEFKKVRTADPKEFLELLYAAKYVFTTSFHATALSIIFNKEFKVELTDGKKFNSRVDSLLKHFGLEKADIDCGYEYNVDWDKINEIIASDRNKAFDFLNKAIKGDKDE
ncbi:MAG: polysaccharide pyruvyl transferase family protein [Wujia sp.]